MTDVPWWAAGLCGLFTALAALNLPSHHDSNTIAGGLCLFQAIFWATVRKGSK